MRDETLELVERYGDERRTDVVPSEVEKIDIEDLIQREDMVVIITHRGYTKRVPWSAYKVQGRGGKGTTSSGSRADNDFMEQLFIGSTHDYLLFVSSAGRAYYLKVHEIPEASATRRARTFGRCCRSPPTRRSRPSFRSRTSHASNTCSWRPRAAW